MDILDVIREYLPKGHLAQLATTRGGQPWVCTVHFVFDDDLNLYWLSLPSRRHSKEIETNNYVAMAIVIKPDHPVIGIQAEGRAEAVKDNQTVKKVMKSYVEKYSIGHDFYERVVDGKNKHQLYKLTPTNFVLFDEVKFKDDTRQEVEL